MDAKQPFREGSAKAKLFLIFKDGKKHPMEELHKGCDKLDVSRSILGHVFHRLEELKFTITKDRESIQCKAPAKAA